MGMINSRTATFAQTIVVGRVDENLHPLPVVSALDDDSHATLESMAHEITRGLGGDGLLITWHGDAGEPRHLFADGSSEALLREGGDLVAWAASATRSSGSVAKSHWKTLEDHPLSGVLTTTIPGDHGVLTIATLFKRIGKTRRTAAGESAARLLPFVQPFFRTWLSRLKTLATVRALTSVVNGSDVGVLLLDRAGQLIFANTPAEALLASGNGFRRKGTTIVAGSMTETLRLHTAIEHAVAPAFRGARPSGNQIVALSRREGRPLMAAVVPSDDVEAASADCAAVVYVVDPDQDLKTLIEPICSFYRLSPKETSLACALARGYSLAEAAAELHLRDQTARTYLKQIFLKTDTNRQVELVRLLLLSAVRTSTNANHRSSAKFNQGLLKRHP